jgi:tetratricopeptide (TPR) repeat protein
MNSMTSILVLNRWPETLHQTLHTLAPYVSKKIAIVDQNPDFICLDAAQAAHFDAIEYLSGEAMDRLRNKGIELARAVGGGNWALVVDSDEFIDAQSLLTLCAAIASTSNSSAFLLPQFNYVGDGRWATSYALRVFRLDRPIEYSYAIHETVSPSLASNNLRWQYADAGIQHLDFVNPVSGKRARYKALLETAIGRGDDLAFLKSLYAAECFFCGELDTSFRQLDEAIVLAGDSARRSRLEGRDDFPVMLKAQLFLCCGELDQAAVLFEKLYDRRVARTAAESALGLAFIASSRGNQAKTLEWIEASLTHWKSAEAIVSRAAVLHELNEPHSALRDLARGLSLNPMAGDPRILVQPYPETIFRWQCLMNPGFRGLPDLLRKLTQRVSARAQQSDG